MYIDKLKDWFKVNF